MNLFLEEKVDVVYPEGHELIVWAIDIQQKSAERNKDRPSEMLIGDQFCQHKLYRKHTCFLQ